MRIQVWLPCLLVIVLCALAARRSQPTGKIPFAAPESAPAATSSVARSASFGGADEPAAPNVGETVAPPVDDDSRRAELSTAGQIEAALADADPEKRAEAREAAMQSGDRGLIPFLQQAADLVPDAHEKDALLEAADFLSLSTMTEADPDSQSEGASASSDGSGRAEREILAQ